MTEREDDNGGTRPISVAELLAKNGTIGAPPAGGRRRRRRGNSDAVTVAELTGEIPIVTDDAPAPERASHAHSYAPARRPVQEPIVDDDESSELSTSRPLSEPEVAAEDDYASHLEQRDVDPDPVAFEPPRRSQKARPTGFTTPPAGSAEEMSPDPVVDDELADLAPDVDFDEVLDQDASDDDEVYPMSSYLRSKSTDTLFGGQAVDESGRVLAPGPEDIDLDDDEMAASADAHEPAEGRGSALLRGVWVVAQCILAVAFGAGLFVAFDQLWQWNTIVALVLSVLVILGLVVGVRVVRKTEDIGSTLIAVAVGALVTLGPLALLQSH